MSTCPCCSEKPFTDCCEPILKDQSASTALTLMRSRYTAFHQGLAHYLQATTHSSTSQQNTLSDLETWSSENDWIQLEILDTARGQADDADGTVEFKAHFKDKHGSHQIHHERSNFSKEDGKWYYVDGKIFPQYTVPEPKILRNGPCPCGSGKKYKKCCA